MASLVGEEEECDGQMRVSLSWLFHDGAVMSQQQRQIVKGHLKVHWSTSKGLLGDFMI